MRRTPRSQVRRLETRARRARRHFYAAPYGDPASARERRRVNHLYRQWERKYYRWQRARLAQEAE
jgi:hypothetical protein